MPRRRDSLLFKMLDRRRVLTGLAASAVATRAFAQDDDPLNQLRWSFNDLLITLRELAAIAAYKYQGRV